MSRENVEIVQRVYEAAARRDMETVLALYDPEVEWDGSRSRWSEVMPGFSRWRGHDELRSFFRRYYEMWDSFEDEIKELIDAGDKVVSVVTSRGRGRASGLDVEWAGNAGVWTIRDGKVVRVVWFPSREEALEAAGLREQALSRENVERLRPLYDAWRRGAYDEGLEVLDPEIEWVAAAEIPGHPGTSYGRAAASKYLAQWRETWETYSVEVERFIDLGDQVLALARERGRGRGSGLTLETEFAQLWTMQEGRAVRMQEWRTWKDALDAVGLSEQAMLRENVEVMEAAYAAIGRDDLDAFLALAHPEIEFRSLIAEAEGRTFRGHEGVREWWDSVIRSLGIRPGPEAIEGFRDRGITCLRLAGNIGGVEVPQRMWMAWRMRDGLLVWWATFRTEAEALEAVGLDE